MKTLVLDTSTNLLFISFIFDDKVVYEVKSVGLNNHSDYLLDLIQKGLNETNIQVKDFDKIIKIYVDTKQAFKDKNVLTSFERKPKVI